MHIQQLISEGGHSSERYVEPKRILCPSCNSQAEVSHFESCNGGCINQQRSIDCTSCGYHSCDDECCNRCYELSLKANRENALLSLGINNKTDALFFLASIESRLICLLFKVGFYEKQNILTEEFFDMAEEVDEIEYLLDTFSSSSHTSHQLAREINRSNFCMLGRVKHDLNHC